MATPAQSAHTVRFGPFELDTQAGELRKYGIRLKLQGQPFQVLEILLEQAGEVVTREALRQRLWPGDTFVNFDHSLNNAVARIREALGDSAETPHYIQTVPRRGYRFIGSLEREPLSPRAVLLTPSAGGSVGSPARRYLTWILVGLSAVLIAASWLAIARKFDKRSASPNRIQSLVVLPFENLSGDAAQDYLADGMTDELITDLAGFDSLRVISRTSAMAFRDAHKPLKTIARELNVDAVVEGSISRSGNRVRVRVQLIDARTDQHRWAQSYERDITDVVELESDLARQLAEQVSIHLSASTHPALAIHPRTPEAYEDYLKGWYFFDKRNGEAAKRSVEYFRKSIAQDPKFALAYVGLAEALETLSALDVAPYSQTESEALHTLQQALQLDPGLGEAHSALGLLEAQWNWNWSEAERQMKLGLELSPGSAVAHNRYAVYLQAVGRLDESVLEARRAAQLDPLSFFMNRELGRALYLARRYDEANRALDRSAELDPNTSVVDNWRSWIAERQGNYALSVELALNNMPKDGVDANTINSLRRAYKNNGWIGFCQAMLRLDLQRDTNLSAPYFIAVDEARLGNKDAAFAWLETALRTKSVWIMWIKVDPLLDGLRSDPRFPALVRRMGLP